MQRYIVRRFLSALVVLFILSLLTFSLLHLLPGDPLVAYMGESEGRLDKEQVQLLRKELRLDQPIPVRYALWLSDVLQGNLGRSLKTTQPVTVALLERLPVTIQLAVVSWVIGILIAFPAGIFATQRQGTWSDFAATIFAVGGVAAPNFWVGMILILVFAVLLGWLPPSGYVSILSDPWAGLRSTILPAIALGWSLSAVMMRQIRSSLLEVYRMDYITTARSKGLTERTVLLRHALRNGLIPVLTVMGLQVSRLLGGTVLIERLFAWPGIGRLAVDAIFNRDFPVVMGVVMFAAVVVLMANLVVDLTYGIVDPRIRYE